MFQFDSISIYKLSINSKFDFDSMNIDLIQILYLYKITCLQVVN